MQLFNLVNGHRRAWRVKKENGRKSGEMKDAAVNIKYLNEASSELDLDIENMDLLCKNRERQVMKCDKALESVASEKQERVRIIRKMARSREWESV
ncbi:unnamed protein product [Onchocerca flexuosa]|uniref:NAM-associated domain-containing protein n=1 Tax=Onchocerca flexuosa TaxID=387005 RepID=A0A183H2N9_9BILA|nr:unnamed protein product [Onchocerca flexuosa]